MKDIIKKAIENGHDSLSEFDSKRVIQRAGVQITNEELAVTREEAVEIARKIGYPVVLKGTGHKATHKTEMGLVKLRLNSDEDVSAAYDEIMSKDAELEGVLVQEMISGEREFVIGLTRDPQFGPCVMFGLGGIFTEVLNDVSFRVAPLTDYDAEDMISEIKTNKLLEEFRGSPAVDREILKKALIGIGNLGLENDEIKEIDINPVIISGDKPIAVDALVVLGKDD